MAWANAPSRFRGVELATNGTGMRRCSGLELLARTLAAGCGKNRRLKVITSGVPAVIRERISSLCSPGAVAPSIGCLIVKSVVYAHDGSIYLEQRLRRCSSDQFVVMDNPASKVNDAVLVVWRMMHSAARMGAARHLCAAGLSALAVVDAPARCNRRWRRYRPFWVMIPMHMPGANGYELLSSTAACAPTLPVVLMTAYGTVAQAVAAMREGATTATVPRCWWRDRHGMSAGIWWLRESRLNELIAIDLNQRSGEATGAQIVNDAKRPPGESGTAVAVTRVYLRITLAGAPLVSGVRCHQLQPSWNMLEASLFGYEKGAFTGVLPRTRCSGAGTVAARCWFR